MKEYGYIFFDLDRTLWDFNKNAKEAIVDLLGKHNIVSKLGVDEEEFFNEYQKINDQQWILYRSGKITKDELRLARFHHSFMQYGLNDQELALQFNDDYVALCSSKSNLIPHAKEVLDYLQPKYNLSIITNGFVEAQYVKIENSGLSKYFQHVIVSDGLGYKKPDRRIFHHAMKLAGARSANSLMIGDDYRADIIGAKKVGMDQAFYSDLKEYKQEATYTLSSLLELKKFL